MNASQAARLARQLLDSLQPDLVVLQPYNRGVRVFHRDVLRDPGLLAYALRDPDFVLENFPPPRGVRARDHEARFRAGALYRLAVAVARPSTGAGAVDATADRETAALLEGATARGVPVLYASIPAERRNVASEIYEGPRPYVLNLFVPGREAAFYGVHPPAAYLDEFARRIADEIVARGWPTTARYHPAAPSDAAPLPAAAVHAWSGPWAGPTAMLPALLAGSRWVLAATAVMIGGLGALGLRRRRRQSR